MEYDINRHVLSRLFRSEFGVADQRNDPDRAIYPDKGASDEKRVIDGRGNSNQSTNHNLRTLAASLAVPY